jgi:hypothetical protein
VNEQNLDREFREALSRLVGQRCWSLVAGPGTGSHLAMDFGGKVEREVPLSNPHLTEDQRRYAGEFALFITCTWRLDRDAVITGSDDSNAEGDGMLTGLQQLVDRAVQAVDCDPIAYDLTVHFEDDYRLTVFCDQIDSESADNYTLFSPERIFGIETMGRLTAEPRVKP